MRSFRQSRLIWCLVLMLGLVAFVFVGGCGSDDDDDQEDQTTQEMPSDTTQEPPPAVTRADVVKTNADIAFAGYSDALRTAMDLQTAVNTFVDDPTMDTFDDAKMAWLRAREAYQPTEVYRFRPGPIEDLNDDGELVEGEGPEARINGWPLGEALVDYVADGTPDGDAGSQDSYDADGEVGPVHPENIVSDTVNIPMITIAAIMPIVELGDESGIGTGYHAVEFLLWGQDLNEGQTMWDTPRDNTPGQRPVSDYYQDAEQGTCTSGPTMHDDHMICMRRATYLEVATELLVDDLRNIAYAWDPDGDYYAEYTSDANTDASLASILESMGRMGFGELAGERINIARANNSQEDEHSCFSDNTHRDILLNVVGIQNQYLGEYDLPAYALGEFMFDGTMMITGRGHGIYDLLKAEGHADVAEALKMAIAEAIRLAMVIDTKARDEMMPFDQQIEVGPDNPDIKGLIAALVTQTELIEDAIQALGLETGDLEQDTEEEIKGVS